MPELPEVETFTRTIAERAVGRTVARVEHVDDRILTGVGVAAFERALAGRRLARARRHGKWSFVETAGPALALHFGMTGSPWPLAAGEPPPRHARLLLRFRDGGGFALDDPRVFGEVTLARSVEDLVRARRLGPDALALDARHLAARLKDRRAPVKAALLDQSVVAGVGNLYADEALWRARLDPRRPAGTLAPADARRLAAAVRAVLRAAVDAEAEWERYPRGWLLHRREEGGACPRCGRALARGVVGGRTTYWCRECQE